MTAWQILRLAAAGCLGGAMNAIAGGGSFAVFPSLVAAGLPSQIANASTTMSLLPGGVASAWAYRADLAPIGAVSLRAMIVASLGGGAAGAALLLATPSSTFDKVVPWLLLIATIMLALGDRPRRAMERLDWTLGPVGALSVQAALAVYGGYFGGAVGLMMFAAWSPVTRLTLKEQLPARTVMVCAANAAAAIWFAAAGVIAWAPTAAALSGGIAGGYLGARLGRRLPPKWVCRAVLAVCAATTISFFVRGYF